MRTTVDEPHLWQIAERGYQEIYGLTGKVGVGRLATYLANETGVSGASAILPPVQVRGYMSLFRDIASSLIRRKDEDGEPRTRAIAKGHDADRKESRDMTDDDRAAHIAMQAEGILDRIAALEDFVGKTRDARLQRLFDVANAARLAAAIDTLDDAGDTDSADLLRRLAEASS